VNQNDGNQVVYDQDEKAIWASNTAGKGQGALVYQTDGNLVLYKHDHSHSPEHALWATGTNGKGTGHLIIQNDGNLVIYDSGNKPLWASNTPREHKGHHDTLRTGHALRENQELRSPNGEYRAAMQADGNFVVYHHQRALWASNTVHSGGHFWLINQTDGNVVVYDKDDKALWATGTNGKTTHSRLVIQNDGNLVLYSDSTAIWASGTNGK